MSFEHLDVVYFAKTYGLVFMMAFFIVAVIYTYWPTNRKRFEEASTSIIDDEDKPA